MMAMHGQIPGAVMHVVLAILFAVIIGPAILRAPPLGGRIRLHQSPGHESASVLVGGVMLEGDRAVRHRLRAATGGHEQPGQVRAQADVVGGRLHGPGQGVDKRIAHRASL